MVAHTLGYHPHRRPREFRCRALRFALWLNLMGNDGENQFHVNWNAVATAVIGTVSASGLLGLSGGILYIAWTVPSQQSQILKNQTEFQQHIQRIETRLERLEAVSRHLPAEGPTPLFRGK